MRAGGLCGALCAPDRPDGGCRLPASPATLPLTERGQLLQSCGTGLRAAEQSCRGRGGAWGQAQGLGVSPCAPEQGTCSCPGKTRKAVPGTIPTRKAEACFPPASHGSLHCGPAAVSQREDGSAAVW